MAVLLNWTTPVVGTAARALGDSAFSHAAFM
jgi:hypothetical protein